LTSSHRRKAAKLHLATTMGLCHFVIQFWHVCKNTCDAGQQLLSAQRVQHYRYTMFEQREKDLYLQACAQVITVQQHEEFIIVQG
jgi:hypothetical protein